MNSAVFVCSFSGAIGEMKRKDQGDPEKVLAVLEKSSRVSCFDLSENQTIARTVTRLKRDGLIEYPQPQPGYPWNNIVLTEAGKLKLKEVQHANS